MHVCFVFKAVFLFAFSSNPTTKIDQYIPGDDWAQRCSIVLYNKEENKLWTKLCQAQGRNYVLISLVIENLDPKLLYKLKDKHVKI